jgi:hypothetical protein
MKRQEVPEKKAGERRDWGRENEERRGRKGNEVVPVKSGSLEAPEMKAPP